MVKGIRSLEKLIKEVDKTIDDLVVILPEYQYLTSIPGIYSVYAARVLAELVLSSTVLMKENWRQRQASQAEYENIPMAKQDNRYLRYYLVKATDSIRRYETEYNAYYKKK